MKVMCRVSFVMSIKVYSCELKAKHLKWDEVESEGGGEDKRRMHLKVFNANGNFFKKNRPIDYYAFRCS